MIETLTFALHEMTGEKPVDNRTVLVDPDTLREIARTDDRYSIFEDEDEVQEKHYYPPIDMRTLSPMEAQVLLSLMDGKKYRDIAREMGVSKRSVQTHAERAKAKLERMRENGVQCALFDDFGDMGGVYISGLFRQTEAEVVVQ